MELYVAFLQNDTDKINNMIMKNKNIIYESDYNGNTVAHLLAINKNYNLLLKLIDKYPELISYLNNNNKSVIHLVEDKYILHKLLDKTSDSNLNTITDDKTLLIMLLNKNDHETIDKIINRVDLNIPVDDPPLNYYLEQKNIEYDIVLKLVQAGANVNLNNKIGLKSLNIAVLNNLSTDIIELLLENGSNINYAGPGDRFLPLNVALKRARFAIVEKLLEYDPDLSLQDNNLFIPLHYAIISKKSVPDNIFTKLLLDSNLNTPNIKGQTALHLLIRTKLWKKYINLLKHKNIDLNIIDTNGSTAISYMNWKKMVKLVNSLSDGILNKKLDDNELKSDKIYKESSNSLIRSKLFDQTNSEIILPEVSPIDHTVFGSNVLYNMIYLIQILKKYDNLFIPFQYMIPDKYINEMNTLKNYNLYRTKQGQLLNNLLEIYTSKFYELVPGIIIWYNKNIYHYNHNLRIYFKKLLNNDKIRFIIIKLSLITKNNLTHANILLYDKETGIAQRFEPYGYIDYYIEDVQELDKLLKQILNDAIGKIIYKEPNKTAKFQLVSNESLSENKKLGDPTGFCLAWCYWFIELKLSNPDYDTDSLLDDTLMKLVLNNNSSNSNNVLDYIRSYAKNLDSLKNEYLLSIGFKKNELYNLTYDKNKFDYLIKNISKTFNDLIDPVFT